MLPIAGSAYTYAYATMGEFVAWIIGWALVLEYALGAATLSIAWSEYLNKLLGGWIPYQWCHSPMETSIDGASTELSTAGAVYFGVLIAGIDQGHAGIGEFEFDHCRDQGWHCSFDHRARLALYSA